MNNQPVPYANFVKGLVLTGLDDAGINQHLIRYELPRSEQEIREIRNGLNEKVDCKTMIDENQIRFENGEKPLINEKVKEMFDFQDDFVALINDFSCVTPIMKRGKLAGVDCAVILIDDKLRYLADNFAFTYLDFEILEQPLLDLQINLFSEEVFKRYCYWFWNVGLYDQSLLVKYLLKYKQTGQYFKYINPVRDGINEIISSITEPGENEIIRNLKIGKSKYQTNISRALDHGQTPDKSDVNYLRTATTNINRLEQFKTSIDSDTDLDVKYDRHMREDDSLRMYTHDICLVPHEKLIEILIYIGNKIEDVQLILRKNYKFNPIPKCFLENIYHICTSFPGGMEMVKKNQKKLPLKETLVGSPAVRKSFRHPEMLDQALLWPRAITRRSVFTINKIIKNPQKRNLLELSLIVEMDFDRLYKAWIDKFKEKLTIKEYDLYKYYCWNLPRTDFRQGLYQYLQQNPDNWLYRGYFDFFDREPIDVILYFGLFSKEEREITSIQLYDELLFQLKYSLKNNVALPKWMSQELRRLDKKMEIKKKEEGYEYYRKQLERIFSRITGKTRYDLTLDMIKNKRKQPVAEGPEHPKDSSHNEDKIIDKDKPDRPKSE
ncbi:MAG: hypothetical protein P9L97_09155 [Candidatus Tenebribacter davisii]|nr:hypothetical protein [Candidatus Tenebribacter davisii]